MAISRSKAIEQVNSCTKNAIEIQQDISKVQGELSKFSSEVSSVAKSVSKKLRAEEIASGCSNSLNRVNGSISDCSFKMGLFLQGLAKDVNNYIDKIEKEYNDDLARRKKEAKEGEEINEEPLNFKRIALSNAGTFSLEEAGKKTSTSKTSKTTSTGTGKTRKSTSTGTGRTSSSGTGSSSTGNPGTGSTGSSSTGSNGYMQSFIDAYKVQLDYVLNRNVALGIDSSRITNWDAFILDFIKMNGFENQVQSIKLSGGLVKCILKNGKSYDFSNIISFDGLVLSIKKVL